MHAEAGSGQAVLSAKGPRHSRHKRTHNYLGAVKHPMRRASTRLCHLHDLSVPCGPNRHNAATHLTQCNPWHTQKHGNRNQTTGQLQKVQHFCPRGCAAHPAYGRHNTRPEHSKLAMSALLPGVVVHAGSTTRLPQRKVGLSPVHIGGHMG